MDINELKQFVPFSELDEQYLGDVLGQISEKSYNKGDMLFKRGRLVAQRYYLLAGRVDLIDAEFVSTPVEARRDQVANALNPESPTRCSCIAKSPVKVFTIESEALDRMVAWSESAAIANDIENETPEARGAVETLGGYSVTGEMEVSTISDDDATDWMSSMLQSPLFNKIPLTQVQELFTRFQDIAVKEGEDVVKEGGKGDYFYVLASGRAKVTNRSESVDVVLEPGSYFGEEALLGATTRNATVTMLEGGRLKRLNTEDFEHLLKTPILQYVVKEDLEGLDRPYKVIDVKMPLEYRMFHVEGSINVPLSRLRSSMVELAKSSIYVVADDAGSRADIAAHLLCQAGFDAYILSSENSSEAVQSE